MTPEQLDEWIEASELDHIIGLEKLYAQLALIATALVNSWGGEAKPEHFIPRYEPRQGNRSDGATATSESENVSPNQQAMMFKMYAGRAGWGVQ